MGEAIRHSGLSNRLERALYDRILPGRRVTDAECVYQNLLGVLYLSDAALARSRRELSTGNDGTVWVDYETLGKRKSGLVHASSTGYEADGHLRGPPGQAPLIQSLCGLISMTGSADDSPMPTRTTLVDFYSALLLAF